MTYLLTLVLYCIGTSYGFLAKNDKKILIFSQQMSYNSFSTRWKCMFSYYLPELLVYFCGMYDKIFDLTQRKQTIFSTDMYHKHSVKPMKRSQQSCGRQLNYARKSRDWKTFLSNTDNKRQPISCLSESMGIRPVCI